MEAESSVLPTNIDVENQNQIEYAYHVHPLTLCDTFTYGECSLCGEPCTDEIPYECNECGLFLHESCTKIQIPQEIDHYFHPHPLRLAMEESENSRCCAACCKPLCGLRFECQDCKFYMDVPCALLPTELKQDGCIDYIQHFIHPHPLIEIDEVDKIDEDCSICREKCLDRKTYGCNKCQLFLHESCTKIEIAREIYNDFHPHPLRLTIKESNDSYCAACCKRLRGLMFECQDCEFYMDVECTALLPTNQIKYAYHVHPLTLCETSDKQCSICYDVCCDERPYGCNQCGLFLHESCTKIDIPQEIHHYFHPHPLRLAMEEGGYYSRCAACCKPLCGLSFVCQDCKFYMDVSCALLPTELKQDGCTDYIQHFIHPHPLILYEIDEGDEIDEDCSICREKCLDQKTYGCNPCQLFLHESCTKIEIPREIYHDFHLHPLRLTIKESNDSYCAACCKPLGGLMFECQDCEFYMDVECALLLTKMKQDGYTIDHIQHFLHHHPLILCGDEKKYENNLCFGCGGALTTRPCFSDDTSLLSDVSESIYGCLLSQCGFYLHERCARLPQEIDSQFHPDHSLKLIGESSNAICKGCGRRVNGFMYECCDCNFTLGIECAILTPILKLECHTHLLTLFPSINSDLRCDICNEACDSSNIFRCIDCNYNLHLHCGPLPCSIKDKCHIDPLKLTYDFVEEGYEDDTVYCDACEQPRDPNQCVYHCKDCNFITELKCVEAEVLRSLKGERGNVKLSTANKTRIRVGAKLISYVITNNVETDSDNETNDISAKYLEVKVDENLFSGCYTDEEREQLIEIFNKARVQLHPSDSILHGSNKALSAGIRRYYAGMTKLRSKGELELESDEESDNGENAIAEPYSHDFKQSVRDLDSYYEDNKLIDMFFWEEYNIVRIGEHMVVQDAASVLKGLLHKYGDFTAKSKLSERLKAVFLTMFCAVIYEMCLTNVREVDKKVLKEWWKSFKLVELAGFEIEFAIDELYKLVQASFGRQTITSYNEKKSRVDKISNNIEEEEEELEAKKRALEAKKRELEELKSDVEKDKYAIEYPSSSVLKECLKHESELKWKKAWDGSPIMFL